MSRVYHVYHGRRHLFVAESRLAGRLAWERWQVEEYERTDLWPSDLQRRVVGRVGIHPNWSDGAWWQKNVEARL